MRVEGAVTDNQGAHQKMSDTYSNAPGRAHLISDIAKWFHAVVAAESADVR